MSDKGHTVSELARLAGVSVRTLHHYDSLGLLVPSARTRSGYRLYGRSDLLRLQEILLLRNLGMSLDDIRTWMDRPGRDPVRTLERHRGMLEARMAELEKTLATIDRTIRMYKENTEMTDEEMYEGIKAETARSWMKEARERWDPAMVEASERRVKAMGKEGMAKARIKGQEATQAFAAAMDRNLQDPGSPEAQAAAALQWEWIGCFYDPTPEIFKGLGQMYVDDPRFAANYEPIRKGLAAFMRDAMERYADSRLY